MVWVLGLIVTVTVISTFARDQIKSPFVLIYPSDVSCARQSDDAGAFAILNLQKLPTPTPISGNVSQCYLCNSLYCSDPYDSRLGAIAKCADVYKNAKLYSNRIVASTISPENLRITKDSRFGSDNSEDIETLSSQDSEYVTGEGTHSRIFDIQRKLWEFFNKGEIDENTQFVCVKANYYSDNGQTKTYRGCVPRYTKSISTACDFVNQKVVDSSTSNVYTCNTCETNLCNSGVALISSVLMLVVGVILKVVI